MKHLLFQYIAICTFVFLFFSAESQITVSKAGPGGVSSSINGFYYNLPQTIFKVDVTYEETTFLEGPLSKYAYEYLGVNDFISEKKTEYKILNVDVNDIQEADPEQLYVVQFPLEKAKDAKPSTFSLSDLGSLVSYNKEVKDLVKITPEIHKDQTFIYAEGEERFKYLSQYNKQKKIDTIVRTINIDTVVINRFLFNTSWVDKNDEDKAKEAALQVERIRESRYNLITGYHEINFGNSLVYMDMQLKKLEQQYLELFVGKTVKSMVSKTYYFIPEKSKKIYELARFPDGNSIMVRLNHENLNELSSVPNSLVNEVYYRIPTNASVTVSVSDDVKFSGRYLINQLGNVATVPLGNNQLTFDPYTGMLTTIKTD